MGDHFDLLVDRLLTESTLEAALESRMRALQAASSAVNNTEIDVSLLKMGLDDVKCSGKMVECRICHDDDDDSNMETPCSCCGSLKYAHRRCIQRWCNEKGDTTCEICHQPFKPGYTAPPPLFQFGRIPMSFRGNWEISRRDLNSAHLVSMVPTDQNLINSNYDQYSASSSESLIWCRSVAVIFMVLLVLRHTLPLVISGSKDYYFPLFMVLLFRSAGIVVPVYFMARAVALIQRHRRQHRVLLFRSAGIVVPVYFMARAVALIQRHRRQHREHPSVLVSSSDDEIEQEDLQPQPHIIHLV